MGLIIPDGTSRLRYWWKRENYSESDVYQAICGLIRTFDSRQVSWMERNRRNMSLYSDNALRRMGISDSSTIAGSFPDGRIKLNVVRACVDTAVSYIGTQKPTIFNLTENGDFAAQQRGKKLNQFVNGIFYQTNQYEHSKRVFQFGAILGTGFLKQFERRGKVACEPVLPENVLIDEREALFGRPQSIYQYDELPRDLLMDLYPKAKKPLKDASNTLRNWRTGFEPMSDVVSVVEAWHMGQEEDRSDGRHVIVTDSCTLLDEAYDKDYFPINPLRWGDYPLGYFGYGIPDQLVSIQLEINYICAKIQTLMTLATTQILLEKGSKLNKQAMTNTDFAIHEYSGTPPIFAAVQSVSPEYFSHLDRLYNRAFEIAGISQLSAQAVKPAGLNSGKALLEFNENQNRRFLNIGQQYEDFHVKIADIYCDMVNDISEKGDGYQVIAKEKRGVDLLNWNEVKVDRDKMISMPFPTAFFANTPSGKWEQVQQMMQAGFLGREEAMMLMEYPDLDSIVATQNAPLEYLHMCVEQMLDHGEPCEVDPNSNLGLAITQLPREILRAKINHVPEERIDLLRQYEDEVQRLLSDQEQQARKKQQQMAMAQQAMQQQIPGAQSPQMSQLPPEALGGLLPSAQRMIQ